jgi:two-component system sensor histidine kinase/response regulator
MKQELKDFFINRNNAIPLRVLCVDDDKIIQFTIQRAFVICGFITDMAFDGLHAIDLVSHSYQKYDFILMDIHMPNMDGIEAAKMIRSIRNYESTPIFALTGDMTMEAKLKVVSAGMNEYFPKPVDMELVLSTMKTYL